MITTIISIAIVGAQCRPFDKLRDEAIEGTFWSREVGVRVGYYNGAVAVITDWGLSSLPIAVMWNLQMTVRKKAGICFLMGLGYL